MTATSPSWDDLTAECAATHAGSTGHPPEHVRPRLVDDAERGVPTGGVGDVVLGCRRLRRLPG